MKNNTTGLKIVLGTAFGIGLGMLLAPAKGSKTRKKIKKKIDETKEALNDETTTLQDTLNHTANDIGNEMEKHSLKLGKKTQNIVKSMSRKTDDLITVVEDKLKELKDKNKKLHTSVE